MTSAPVLALIAAFWFSLATILLRRGLQYAGPLPAAFISVSFTGLFVWLATATTASLGTLLTPRILPFLVAGAIAPGIARFVLYVGVDRVGVSRTSSLASAAPLFAVILAVAFLGERPGGMLIIGVLCVVAGGALLSARGSDDHPWRRRDLVFPVLAGVGFATRDTITRWALRDFPQPLAAAAAASLASILMMWSLSHLSSKPIRSARGGLRFFVSAGLCEGLAFISMLRALSLGDVSVVTPLVHSQPFFTMTLATVFLRDLERVTWKIVLAAALIVAGVAVVIRFR